jgi:hypothetical protein
MADIKGQKGQSKFRDFMDREMCISMVFWLIVFLIVAIVKVVG